MKSDLLRLRADIAEQQRLAGVSLADTIQLQRATSDIFTCHSMGECINSLLCRIEDMTQQLIEIDNRLEACEDDDPAENYIEDSIPQFYQL